MGSFRNVFACLVHESHDCIIDLVRNLRHADPSSPILLYNGGKDPQLLNDGFPFSEYGALVHPAPRPLEWGWLHDFALDCMRFALKELQFDTLTIVDSDQLAIGTGYSARLADVLRNRPRIGLLGNAPEPQRSNTRIAPAKVAFAERELWRPFLHRFPHGERKFVHWTFWPSTVFTAAAAQELTQIFACDRELQGILSRTKIWASEEVILPTLVALLGYEVAANPWSYDYVQYKTSYSLRQIDAAISNPRTFWVHPVPRRYDDPLRQHIRKRRGHYRTGNGQGARMSSSEHRAPPELLLTCPILEQMRTVEGWLEDEEADLLIAATATALRELPETQTIVEVGSYCGRSTVVLGSVVKRIRPDARVFAVDPHDGRVGALDLGISATRPTLEVFRSNVAAAGLTDIVEVIAKHSFEVAWDRPIGVLLIDGLHDYINVSRDFFQFERWIVDGGYIAFHDYADYYPGVMAFVDEVLASRRYRRVHCARSMMVVQKIGGAAATGGGAVPRERGDNSTARARNLAAGGKGGAVRQEQGRTMASFRGVHQNGMIVVCGCGESLNEFAEPDRFVTIGVNDVGRRFQPNYLVVVNPRSQFSSDRFSYIENSQAQYIFTQLDLRLPHPGVVKFRLGKYGGTDLSDPETLHYTQNSPYIALCLAAKMGAKRIGLIGVDFCDDHFFARTGRHALTGQLARIDAEYQALGNALRTEGVEVVNLSSKSLLTAFPRLSVEEFAAQAQQADACRARSASLRIVSYSTTPVAGVPAILARCINAKTQHTARCVWPAKGYGNGVSFDGDVEWTERPHEADALLKEADLVIIHNGKVDPRHSRLIVNKAVITMAHNYKWNVNCSFVEQGFPGVVVGQYQATLPEFEGWSVVPNPIPLWERRFQPAPKPKEVTLCFTPSGKHERYPTSHKLYWHSKGYVTTQQVFRTLAARQAIRMETIGDRHVSHAEALAMKARSHIVVDECVTGSYHRNSLEGLAAGCVVVNGVGRVPPIADVFRHCAGAPSPFICANLDDLEAVLSGLIGRGAEELAQLGLQNRHWMERHWGFARQWGDFWEPVIARALRHREDNQGHAKSVLKVPETKALSAPAAVGDVSVIIPHGGQERLANLVATLANLRECQGVGAVTVVEMGELPIAYQAAREHGAGYVFSHAAGEFSRAQALNRGTPFIRGDAVLWLDNDLLVPRDFVCKAKAELDSRQLDCLVPWTSIRYLSREDTSAVLLGKRQAAACTAVRAYSSRQACGGAILTRTSFLLEHGGMFEDFIGWGGEDNAWFHKARLLGRAAASERKDQHLWHLFHPNSGGYGTVAPNARNPGYERNVTLLESIRSVKTSRDLRRRYPAPAHFACPWPSHAEIAFVVDDSEPQVLRRSRDVASAMRDLYGIDVRCVIAQASARDWSSSMSHVDPCAVVLFGTALGLRLLSDEDSSHWWSRSLIVHDSSLQSRRHDAVAVLSRAGAHLIDETLLMLLGEHGLGAPVWRIGAPDRVTARESAISLTQPLSLLLCRSRAEITARESSTGCEAALTGDSFQWGERRI